MRDESDTGEIQGGVLNLGESSEAASWRNENYLFWTNVRIALRRGRKVVYNRVETIREFELDFRRETGGRKRKGPQTGPQPLLFLRSLSLRLLRRLPEKSSSGWKIHDIGIAGLCGGENRSRVKS